MGVSRSSSVSPERGAKIGGGGFTNLSAYKLIKNNVDNCIVRGQE